MYTSEIKRPGKKVASTDDGKVIYFNYHLYIKKKNNTWRELH